MSTMAQLLHPPFNVILPSILPALIHATTNGFAGCDGYVYNGTTVTENLTTATT